MDYTLHKLVVGWVAIAAFVSFIVAWLFFRVDVNPYLLGGVMTIISLMFGVRVRTPEEKKNDD